MAGRVPSQNAVSSGRQGEVLRAMGASEAVLAWFDGACAEGAGARPGRVVRVERTAALVAMPPASNVCEVRLTGDYEFCVGDWVTVAGLQMAAEGAVAPVIAAIAPRTSALARQSPARQGEFQILAANMDLVLVVVSAGAAIRPATLERFVALSWESGATPVVVLTKIDEAADTLADAMLQVAQSAPGVEVLALSNVTGEGFDQVAALLGPGRTAALLGSSGVGKSSLVNNLCGGEITRTGAVRERDGKGRHTTTWRELVRLPGGGAVIDTPGLRSVGLWIGEAALDDTFADIAELAAQCRFGDCAHESEPGCAVTAAIADGLIQARRLDSYRKLRLEAAYLERRGDVRLQREYARQQGELSREARSRIRR